MRKWTKVGMVVLIVGACVGIAGAQTKKWRLVAQAWSFSEFTFVEAVAKTKSVGLKYIEAYPDQRFSAEKPDVKVSHNMTAEQRQELKQLLSKEGLTLVNYGVVSLPNNETECRKVFDFAKDMGLENIVSEPPEDAFEMIDRLCNEYKIGVAIHNHPRPARYWDPNTVLKVCGGRSNWIGACADTGHWMRSNLDPLKAVRMLGEAGRIRSFHFKDLNIFGVNDYQTAHDVPWGTGVGKPKEILTELAGLGFEGTFSIEYEYNWYNNVTEIAMCVEWFRKTAAELSVHADLAPARLFPDFNGDLKVDIEDLILLIEHWGQDDPSFDIAPPPWGDGIVDVWDLEGLMYHWGQDHPALVAHWKLDEADGVIAADSLAANDANLFSNPVWQPTGGKIGGALQLDGIDDYMSTAFVLNPGDGAFSAIAWIKGDVPGGVVISQLDGIGGNGETWLGTEPASGKLMTGLVPPPLGRSIPKPLVSELVITDDQWHYIGFVWDGSYRSLYVDGVEVAKDTQALTLAPLRSATGGLYIGAGKNLEAGTFFSGLIDDVRIYNKALSAEQIADLAN